ncbi:MAG: ATP-binding cassette domain-containing protein [Candidatus Merdisoma sp.]|jgi:putative ABC transport system permease protein
MLQIIDVCKEYRTGGLVQKALDHVSLNLRDNEFVAILGPSGSGKTTLLNIIGGLDRYDSGDLVINGISTKKYKDRDWDSYRNHTIGFVFQSYNLIPHQTVLSNVELALTISGIGKAERRERAVKALEQVGLGNQLHKKPSQMSGGQMQRVAIARALVNDPDILLADEPTGALDSATSVQVMDLLQEVAKDRLVVMVTHNPELAEQYATRIVNLRDGRIRSDSDPYEPEGAGAEQAVHKNMGKSSMSPLTALALSFNNLKTKKARTILTSFAGSIGIIGIALILSLSSGVNAYIKDIERETLSEYPLEIQSTGFDFSSMLTEDTGGSRTEAGEVNVIKMVTEMFSTMDSNDLASLKGWLDSGESGIEQYSSAVEYSYDVMPQIYRLEGDGIRQVNPDNSFAALGLGSSMSSSSMMSSMMGTDVFYEMPDNEELYIDQYEVKAGRWPENYNECVLVLTSGGSISDFMLYTMGLRDSVELDEMVEQFVNEENVDTPDDISDYSYDDILGITFKLVSSSDYYEYDSEYDVWRDKTDDDAYMRSLVENGEDLTIVGIVQPAEDASGLLLQTGIAYPASLTQHVAEVAAESEIMQKQLADPHTNVFTNEPFGEESGESDFDMESLFSIDEEALEEMFSFDESNLTDGLTDSLDMSDMGDMNMDDIDMGEVDLSGMINPDNLQLDLPAFPQLNIADLIGSIDFHVSEEAVNALVSGLVEGYQEYAASNPAADYSDLGDHFLAFLQTDEGMQILNDNLQAILDANGITAPDSEQIGILINSLMLGFSDYLAKQYPGIPGAPDITDPDMQALFQEYLQTPEAQAIITEWFNAAFPTAGDFTVTPEQLEKLASDLGAGYQAYAAEHQLADPSKMGEYFADYMNTEKAQAVLSQGVASMVDASGLQEQLAGSMQGYMTELMGSFSSSMGDALKDGMASVMEQVMQQIADNIQSAMEEMINQLGENLADAFQIDPDDFANAFSMNMNADELAELLRSMSSAQGATYESNLSSLDYVDFDNPSSISIYPLDFESKEHVTDLLSGYNSRMEAEGKEDQVITYTDMVGTLMSSVTDIIDVISYVLIAFVAISLVVSSIMIGVITYISVLERKKEIGILRAIGASKGNISQVFNAETFIIGLTAGLIGIGLTLLILIPGNALIHHLAGSQDINAYLPVGGAVILIALSVLLTLLGGLIPSRKAAKSDPVTALRTE